jgi:hypothetical protein
MSLYTIDLSNLTLAMFIQMAMLFLMIFIAITGYKMNK